MLIRELYESGFNNNPQSEQILDDALLRLKKMNIDQIPLHVLVNEVLKNSESSLYVDLQDPQTKKDITNMLLDNPNISKITDNDIVVLKQVGDVGLDNGEIEQQSQEQKDNKMQKIASKNIKDKSKAGEL